MVSQKELGLSLQLEYVTGSWFQRQIKTDFQNSHSDKENLRP